MARLFDSSKMSKAVVTPQGYLRVPATVTRIGILNYKKPDGTVMRQLRLPEEVFKPESLDTLKGLPVTFQHPKRLLDAKTTKPVVVGYTGDTYTHDDKDVHVDAVTIFDQDAIRKIEAGTHEVSLGYDSDLEETPGVWNGQPYDAIQRNIVYNHLSVVDRARCGPDYRLHMDSADFIEDVAVPAEGSDLGSDPSAGGEETPAQPVDVTQVNQPNEGGVMDKIVIGGKEYPCTPELAAAFNSLLAEQQKASDALKPVQEQAAQVPALQKQVGEQAAQVEEKQKQLDTLQAKMDAMEADLKAKMDGADESVIEARVQERARVKSIGAKVLAKEVNMDGMKDLEIKKAVIKARDSKFDETGKSETYISARFDAEAAQLEKVEETTQKLGERVVRAKMDGAEDGSAEAARKRSIENAQKAWQQPLSANKQ